MTYLLIVLAAFFNAIMDALWTKFPTSIFKDLNPNFWNPNVSWKTMTNWFSWVRFDAWHIAKFGMIGSILLAIMFNKSFDVYDFILLPLIWGITFELFYSKLLIKKINKEL